MERCDAPPKRATLPADPGPTNVPDRILRAMAAPTIDHRGPELAALAREVVQGLGPILRTTGPVVIFPSSGTGAWEAALVNTMSPGDQVLAFDTGHFATLWFRMARRFGLAVESIPGSWRRGVEPAAVHDRLARDRQHTIKAVMVVHNETSTGVASRVGEIREAIDAAARHRRHAEATRRAVRGWGLEVWCENPTEYSSSLTAVLVPEPHDADEVRRIALERFDLSLGTGLGRIAGRVFRIGHLGDLNDLMLAGTLSGTEMSLALSGVPIRPDGVRAALDHLQSG